MRDEPARPRSPSFARVSTWPAARYGAGSPRGNYLVRQMSTEGAVPSARFAKMRYRPAVSPFVLQL